MTPAVAIARAAGGAGPAAVDLVHLLPLGCRIDGQARQLALLIDPEFLAEAGWNPARLVFTPPPGHRLLGRPICRAAGCDTTAMGGNRICQSCTNRLAAHWVGRGADLLAARASRSGPRDRAVPGDRLRPGVGCLGGGVVPVASRPATRPAA